MWTDLAGASLVAAAFLMLPGMMVARAAQVRGFLSVALAPALSTTAIAGGAVVAGRLGLPWEWWTPFIAALVMAGTMWLLQRLARGFGLDARQINPGLRGWRSDLPMWLGAVTSAVLLARQLTVVLVKPDALSQTFDNIFHMAAVRYAVETGNASSLAIGGVTRLDGEAAFYPAAFHNLASLVYQVGPSDISLAVNASAVTISALVWPFSCLAVIRLCLPESPAGVLGASVLAAAFSTFPILLLDFGVLYPNLYALALVPALYGLVVQLLDLHPNRQLHPSAAGALLLAMAPGLVLAHPNALMVLVAAGAAPVLAWCVRRWRDEWSSRRRTGALAIPTALLAVFVGLALVAWRVVRPPDEAATWPPIVSAPQAIGEALLNAAPGGGRAAWIVSIVVVAGIVIALRGGRWWLVGSWATIIGLWVVVAAFGPSDLRTYLTGIWYNDPWRFSAVVPLVSFPLGALAIHSLGVRLGRGTERVLAWPGFGVRGVRAHRVFVGSAASLVVLALLTWGTQRASYLEDALMKASGSYALSADSALVSVDEYKLLMRVPEHVGQGAVVATNPWNGSSMLYPLTGIRTTTTHVLYTPSEDQTAIRNELDEIVDSPEACAAVQRMGVTHALDFGTREVHGRSNPYPGFLDLQGAEGFREIDREGDAVLYELTLCR